MTTTLQDLFKEREEVTLDDLFEHLPQMRPCRVCFRGEIIEPPFEPKLVSPTGVFHHADGDTTDCGHDATGPEWWWAL